eukprot:14453835-Heterocapsa_arctica.AAC.1
MTETEKWRRQSRRKKQKRAHKFAIQEKQKEIERIAIQQKEFQQNKKPRIEEPEDNTYCNTSLFNMLYKIKTEQDKQEPHSRARRSRQIRRQIQSPHPE